MSNSIPSTPPVQEIRLPEAAGRRVWLAWAGAILLPTLFLWWFLIRTVVDEERAQRGKTEGRLVSSMNRYLDDLQPERFLNKALEQAAEDAGFPPLSSDRLQLTASQSQALAAGPEFIPFLRQIIVQRTGVQPLFLISFGPDMSSLQFQGDPRYFQALNTPSPRSLRLITQQWLEGSRRKVQDDSETPGIPRRITEPSPEQTSRDKGFARHVIKNLLGDYAPLNPALGRPENFFCHRFGCGRLWLYLRPLTAGSAPDAPILGGFIVLLRDADISRESILAFAANDSEREIWRRQTVPIPQLIDAHDRLSFAFPLPAPLLTPQERGPATTASGLFPSPTLATSAPRRLLQHPLRPWFSSAAAFSILWLVLTYLLFRRLSGRRPSPALPLREKLMVALGFAIVPPLLVLILLTASLVEYGKEENRRTLRGHLRQRLSLIESGLTEFISEQNLSLIRKRETLIPHLFAPPAELTGHFQQFLSGHQFPGAFLIRCDGAEIAHEKDLPGVPAIPAPMKDRLREVARLLAIRLFSETQSPDLFQYWQKHGPPGFWKRDRLVMTSIMWRREEVGPLLGKDVFSVDPSFSGFREGTLGVITLHNDAQVASVGTTLGYICYVQPFLALGQGYFSRLFAEGLPKEMEYPGFELQAAVFGRSANSDSERRLRDSVVWPQQAQSNPQLLHTARAGLANPWSHDSSADDEDIREFHLFHSFPFIAVISAREKIHPLQPFLPKILLVLLCLYFFLLIRFSARLLSRSLVEPMQHLAEISLQVSQGQIPQTVTLPESGEFEALAEDLHTMCKGLREGRLLSRFVSSDACQEIASGTRNAFEPGGALRPTAILFSKIVGFHDLVHDQGSEKSITLLNRYFSCMEPAISQSGGTIDKYIGDAIMAVFYGTTEVSPARQSVLAAISMRKELALLHQEWKSQNLPCLVSGIGIASGPVISGRIGSRLHRMDFTVIGDVVNTAARIESRRAHAHPDSILLDEETAAVAGDLGPITPLGQLELKGKTRPVELFELRQEGDA